MNKKTLIFSLSAILFLALSFIAYSWTEPTTNMPSGYTAPINTSSIAQTKTGEIGASMFRDADNSNYYINPSGNSVVSGKIVTETDIVDSDPFGTIATKGYLDERIASFARDNNLFSNIMYVPGDGVPCPDGTTEIMKHWLPATCVTNYWSCGVPNSQCTTSMAWSNLPTTCSYGYRDYDHCITATCTSSEWDAILCGIDALPGNMLVGMNHSEQDCQDAHGTVVTVEGGVKICQFDNDYLSGNCTSYTCWPCHGNCAGDTCVCPEGWRAYKNWMTTSANHLATGHSWLNEGRSFYSDGECDGWYSNVEYRGCY